MPGKRPSSSSSSQPDGDDATTEEHRLFKEMLGGIREAIWIRDIAQQRLLYVSPGFEWIWGLPVRSLLATARIWVHSIHPEDRDRALAAVEEAILGPHQMEYRIIRPDGMVRRIRDRSYPIRDAGGRVYRLTGIAEDVTATFGAR